MSYSAAKHDEQNIVIIDTRGWTMGKRRVCTGSDEEIIGVTSDSNVASVITINNLTGLTKLSILELPTGAIMNTQTISQTKSKRTPSRALVANNHNVATALDNGRRATPEGINIWLVALLGWIGWCCLKALGIWAWANITYAMHYWGVN